jgi:branched-chain amino acid transport system ATP-binding protein/branched-chain amino acid transport system permease protein
MSSVGKVWRWPGRPAWSSLASPRWTLVGAGASALALGIVYLLTHDSFWIFRMNLVAIYAIVIMGWNLLFGLSGQFSLGHAAFFGTSAYTSALLASNHGVPVFVSILAGTVLAVCVAAVAAVPLLRFRGLYLALVTLALAVVAQSLAVGWKSLTGGTSGLIDVPAWDVGPIESRSAGSSFVFLWILAGVAFVVARAVWRSPFGKSVIAQREDETLAKALGLSVPVLRIKTFLISVTYAGVAGGLLAHYQNFIDPTQVGMILSFDIVVAGIVGGGLVPIGGVVGGFVHVVIPAVLGAYAEWRPLIFGLLLLVVMMALQGGVAGAAHDLARAAVQRVRLRRGLARHGGAARAPARPDAARADKAAAAAARPDVGAVLRAVDVSRFFGGVRAVSSVSLEVRGDEVLAIIGPNGAGKTTLFNLMSGLIRPDSGRIEVMGVDTTGMTPWQISRRGLARTFQTPHVVPTLPVLDNIALGAYGQRRVRAIDGVVGRQRVAREARATAEWWAEVVGVADVLDVPARELPLVQQRFVEIARALCASPAIVLLDEPGAGLADAELERLGRLLRRLRVEEDVAVVVIDHRMSLVLDVADRVIVLDQGRQIASGTGDEIVANEQVLRVYLGADFVHQR